MVGEGRMIAMRPMLSSYCSWPWSTLAGRIGVLATALAVAGCALQLAPPGPATERPRETAGAFIMPDGMRLPYRTWLPTGDQARSPWAVILALHGMNDSRDAWEYPGPELAASGI